MCGNSGSAPPPPPPPEPPKEAPTRVSPEVQEARSDEKKQARAAAGRSGSIKTSTDLATTDPNTAQRTILG